MQYTLDLQLDVDASAGDVVGGQVAFRWLDEMSQALLPDGRAEIADLPARVAKTVRPYGPQGAPGSLFGIGEDEGFTYFFEGSYFVGYRILSRSNWTLHVEASHEEGDEAVRSVWVGILGAHELLERTLRVADATLDECVRRGLTGFGVEALKQTRSDFSATLGRIVA